MFCFDKFGFKRRATTLTNNSQRSVNYKGWVWKHFPVEASILLLWSFYSNAFSNELVAMHNCRWSFCVFVWKKRVRGGVSDEYYWPSLEIKVTFCEKSMNWQTWYLEQWKCILFTDFIYCHFFYVKDVMNNISFLLLFINVNSYVQT